MVVLDRGLIVPLGVKDIEFDGSSKLRENEILCLSLVCAGHYRL